MPPVTFQFLGMRDGCPNTSKLLDILAEALPRLGLVVHLEILDVDDLSHMNDPRAGFGSPTILINGQDLFGGEPCLTLRPACRTYPEGLPNCERMIDLIKAKSRASNPQNPCSANIT